jgi:16S rRNA (cytosine1402-N4)-methyltransferase
MEIRHLNNNDFTFEHTPVLMSETLTHLLGDDGNLTSQNLPGQLTLVDCTLGGAGHALALCERLLLKYAQLPVELLGFDRDAMARQAATQRIENFVAKNPDFTNRFQYKVVPFNFQEAGAFLLAQRGPLSVDFLFADFGVSSPQLDLAERGFSFLREGPLDMRMDPSQTLTALDILQTADDKELTRIFRDYGEEPRARKLATAICQDRQKGVLPVSNTLEFAAYAARVLGYHQSRVHPATRIFQALRMEVNGELEAIDALLEAVPRLMKPKGRAGFISFHSLEDGRVKHRMRAWQQGNNDLRAQNDDPRALFPGFVAACWGKETPRGGAVASEQEAQQNPRARSARLRVFQFEGDATRAKEGQRSENKRR